MGSRTRSGSVIAVPPDELGRDRVFITQIYDSNEYEGNIVVTGNDDWNMGADGIPGPFFNTELIHNCNNG